MQIIDNLISKSHQDRLEQILLGDEFPWYYNNETAYINDGSTTDELTLDVKQFTHAFYKDGYTSNFYSLVYPFIISLEQTFNTEFASRLVRIKANLMYKHPNYPKDFYTIPHIDSRGEIETMLYYVNQSDGATVIFNQKPSEFPLTIHNKVEPVRGRAILFNSGYLHSSTPPKLHDERVVLNFVFKR